MSVSYFQDKNIKNNITVSCRKCNADTKHLIKSEIHESGREEIHDEFIYGWDDRYQIIQCQGCDTISFRVAAKNSENTQHYETPNGYEQEYVETETIYPNPEINLSEIDDDHLIPLKLRKIYKETAKSLIDGNRVLTGIGVRAIVETICKDRDASGSDLYNKIKNLMDTGVINTEDARVLQKLRVLGNKSAHEVTPHSTSQLEIALKVVAHLLKCVYILPEQVNASL